MEMLRTTAERMEFLGEEGGDSLITLQFANGLGGKDNRLNVKKRQGKRVSFGWS